MEKNFAYELNEIKENASGYIFGTRHGDRHRHRFEERYIALRSHFAMEMRKIK